MWINSPLGKWEQDTRLDKALRDAERMRTLEKAMDAGGGVRIGRLLHTTSLRLRWVAARARSTVGTLLTWLATPAPPQH